MLFPATFGLHADSQVSMVGKIAAGGRQQLLNSFSSLLYRRRQEGRITCRVKVAPLMADQAGLRALVNIFPVEDLTDVRTLDDHCQEKVP